MAENANKSAVEQVWICFPAEVEARIDYFPKAESR